MKKRDLTNYERLHRMINEKVIEIALIKNKYSDSKLDYDRISPITYNEKNCQWEVFLTEGYDGYCSMESREIIISKEELVMDIEKIENKLKTKFENK
jgi:hypothetical protein